MKDETQKKFSKGKTNRRPTNKKHFNSKTGRGKTYVDPDQRESSTTTNNPEWYGDNALTKSSANIYFTKPFGSVLPLWSDNQWNAMTNNSGTAHTEYSAPGILVLDLVPAFGSSASTTLSNIAPLNIASQAIYSFVRHANSGSRVYDAPDMITYLVGMADCYSLLNWMERLYACINRYYPQNRYFAKVLCQQMNVDFDSFMGNMAQFNYYINLIISKLSAFAIPGNMDFFTRRAFLYSQIYAEDESVKDQMYLFNPRGFYKYTIDSTYPEAYLKYEALPATITFTGLVTYMNDMVQRFLDSEDIGIMSGDIIKAYGNNIIKLSAFPQEALINPVVHDYNVLFQIRNATIVDSFTPPDVHQDSQKLYLEWDNEITSNKEVFIACKLSKYILTSNNLEPTNGEVLESTRLAAMSSTYEYDGTKWVADLICGTEVCVSMRCIRFTDNAGSIQTQVYTFSNRYTTYSGVGYSILSSFKYHPTLHLIARGSADEVTAFYGVFQDLDNVVLLDWETLGNLHTTAIMNMLAVPAIALL